MTENSLLSLLKQELSRTAARVLLASSALQFPQHMAKQLMKQFIALLRDSSSWRVRLDVLLPLQGDPFLFSGSCLLVTDSPRCIEQSSTITTCSFSMTSSLLN
jgi:hypothetical protein